LEKSFALDLPHSRFWTHANGIYGENDSARNNRKVW